MRDQQQYLLNRRYAYEIHNSLEINAFCIMQTAQWFSCHVAEQPVPTYFRVLAHLPSKSPTASVLAGM
jgi:hypothetical protein